MAVPLKVKKEYSDPLFRIGNVCASSAVYRWERAYVDYENRIINKRIARSEAMMISGILMSFTAF